MAVKVLDTRIQLRYDTLENWQLQNPVLMSGEAAIASITTDSTPSSTIGIKIGDGIHTFTLLPWILAVAADVYNWAKLANKPEYHANEIINLSSFILNELNGTNLNNEFRISYNSETFEYNLLYFNAATESWINIPGSIDISSLLQRLTYLENWANGEMSDIGIIDLPISMIVLDEVINALTSIKFNDNAVEHLFVTAVSQSRGKISVSRDSINFDDIDDILPVEKGGLGTTTLTSGELLVGNGTNAVTTRAITTDVLNNDENDIPTALAVIDYVDSRTLGLTSVMHYIGESTLDVEFSDSKINPEIEGYNFSRAKAGDVITHNAQEFVWTGSYWRLLGDEGSYAIKGSIRNADIAANANIDLSKIANLITTLANKVDVEEGKSLSSNDYTTADKNKLNSLTPTTIDHVFINGDEVEPDTIEDKPKSIAFNAITAQERSKLSKLTETTIDHIYVNNEEQLPNENKEVHITITDVNTINGAEVPDGNGNYEDIEINNKKLELARIAKTGLIEDIELNEYMILYCGTSTQII